MESQCLKWTTNIANKEACFDVQIRCGWLSITTSVSLMVNEFDILSILHEQVNLAAVNLCLS